ncbi:MAG: 16S rRNA (cytosine(1402)-N(4))-methyltransferase [Gammaproteobacteria bacterium]|nr:16S rRNA (cytosine(1402)-N(4))-methyltransferase [Gammaproteobacteria bacterium]
MMAVPLTQQVHLKLKTIINKGDIVVDATVGNGHDTLFLSECVGEQGIVYGFDIQKQAIESTRLKLEQSDLSHRVRLFETSHEKMKNVIKLEHKGQITAIMFNLGYLPGGDKAIKTETPSTILALQQSLELLKPSGILSVVAYPGHPGGDDESLSVRNWFDSHGESSFELTIPDSEHNNVPQWFWIDKSNLK